MNLLRFLTLRGERGLFGWFGRLLDDEVSLEAVTTNEEETTAFPVSSRLGTVWVALVEGGKEERLSEGRMSLIYLTA